MFDYILQCEVHLGDGGQKAHILSEAGLVFKGGGVVEFIDVRGHPSPFHSSMQKQTFLEENSQYKGTPREKKNVFFRALPE